MFLSFSIVSTDEIELDFLLLYQLSHLQVKFFSLLYVVQIHHHNFKLLETNEQNKVQFSTHLMNCKDSVVIKQTTNRYKQGV